MNLRTTNPAPAIAGFQIMAPLGRKPADSAKRIRTTANAMYYILFEIARCSERNTLGPTEADRTEPQAVE